MTSFEAFEHWAGDGASCISDRKRLTLFQEAALQLRQMHACLAGTGFEGRELTEAQDRALWRHAVGAKAAEIFLLSPAGRKSLTQASRTESSESGTGATACNPKVTTEVALVGGKLDADRLAALADEDALDHLKQISCIRDSSQPTRVGVRNFGLAGRRRSMCAEGK